MATKVYWITLRVLVQKVNRYIGKWSAQLSENLDSTQMAAVNSLYESNQQVLAVLPPHEIDE